MRIHLLQPARSAKRRRATLAAVVVAVPIFAFAATSTPASAGGPMCEGVPDKGRIPAEKIARHMNVRACGIVGRTIELDTVGVQVPDATPEGTVITANSYGNDGSDELTVAVDALGDMTLAYESSAGGTGVVPGDEVAGSTSTQGCDAPHYGLSGLYIANSWTFYRGDGAVPTSGGTKAQFADAMVKAANNITGLQGPCTSTDDVTVSFNYAGETTYETDMTATSTGGDCLAPGASGQDDVSTVDFKPLGTGILGLYCGRGNTNNATIEADVRINDNKAWTYNPGNSLCSTYQQYDVEAVITHEFGHVYGLVDLNVAKTSTTAGSYWETMHGTVNACKKYPRTLALGDVGGLRAIY